MLKTRIVWILGSVALIGLILLGVFYPSVKELRANRLADRAEVLLEHESTVLEAWELSQAALALSPQSLQIARTAARAYIAVDPRGAVEAWKRVVGLDGATIEDRRQLAELLLAIGDWDGLAEQVERIREAGGGSIATQLRARSLLAQGNPADGMDVVRKALGEGDLSKEEQLFFADFAMLFDQPEIREEGLEILFQLAEADDAIALDALRRLARMGWSDSIERFIIIERLQAHPGAKRSDQLLAAQLRLEVERNNPNAVVRSAAALFDLADVDDLLEFARWLNRRGLHTAVLDHLPEERAVSRQDLFAIYLDALAALGDWSAIEVVLGRERIPLIELLRSFYRMRVYLETGRMRRAEIELERVLIQAGEDPLKIYYIAERMPLLDDGKLLDRVYRRMTEVPELRRRGYERLLEVGQTRKDSDLIWEALSGLRRYFPTDRDVQSDHLYFRFMREGAKVEGLGEARQLVEAHPQLLAYRMTYMVGLMASGENREALALVDGLPVNWYEVQPRWRVIVAEALRREGYHREATELFRGISSDELLDIERRFLAPD